MAESGPGAPASVGPRRTSASEIAPGVFVGGAVDASAFEGVRVCVRDERPLELDRFPGAVHIPIYDGESDSPRLADLDRVAELVRTARARSEPVLIYCGHGVRRGPLGGAWYLHRTEGIELDAAFDRIEKVRPQIERPREWMRGWRALDPPANPPRRPRGTSDA